MLISPHPRMTLLSDSSPRMRDSRPHKQRGRNGINKSALGRSTSKLLLAHDVDVADNQESGW